jgi:hypothetical protein
MISMSRSVGRRFAVSARAARSTAAAAGSATLTLTGRPKKTARQVAGPILAMAAIAALSAGSAG